MCQSDYPCYDWTDVVEAALTQIKEEAANPLKAGYSIRVNFVWAYVSKDDKIIRSGHQNVSSVVPINSLGKGIPQPLPGRLHRLLDAVGRSAKTTEGVCAWHV